MASALSVSIIGAAGYSGAELLRILVRHPRVQIGRLFAASNAGKPVAEVLPVFRGVLDGMLESLDLAAAAESDLVFIALPSGEAMALVPELLRQKARVVDLGGDFRLKDPSLYAAYYKRTQTAADLLSGAVYGLPEWNAAAIRTARLLANPGCYPTGAILPLLPLIRAGIILPSGIVVNALSGVSGAGRSSSAEMSFAEVNESVRAYKVGTHQHIPEIEQAYGVFGGAHTTVTFIPHLVPITRGIFTTITAPLARAVPADRIEELLRQAYADAPFVRLAKGIPEIKNVTGTNFIDIGWAIYERNNHLLLFSAIDNLIKGAAGQAVQNMNLMCGFPETEGLR